MTLVMQSGWRNRPVAVLHRNPGCRSGRIDPADLALKLRARSVTAVLAHHTSRFLGGIRRDRIFDRASGALASARRGITAVIPTAATSPIPAKSCRRVAANANMPLCVPKTLSVLMPPRNHLSWRNDRAPVFRRGGLGLTIQVEDPA